MRLKESIRRLLREYSEDRIERLRTLVQQHGVEFASKMVAGTENLIKILYNGDLKNFYQETNYVPYKISSDGMTMYIDNMLVNYLNLEDRGIGNEKRLGDFSFGPKGGLRYKFTAHLSSPYTGNDGQIFRRVVGFSGDSGFGYSFINKRNILGKRYRTQIYQQIIDKYNLDSYLL